MTLEEVVARLDRTIQGKELYLSLLSNNAAANEILGKFLQINLIELKNIRTDILKVIESAR